MMLRQTFAEFLDNPMGKGSHAITSRSLIVQNLRDRFAVMVKAKKPFKHTVWEAKTGYYVHVVVPTEAPDRNNTYDVVLHFTVPEDRPDVAKQPTLRDYDISFFSNSPSFVYTHAYAFNFYDAFVDELGNRYDRQVLKNAPVLRNPAIILNYEKTIVYAMLYMELHDLLNKKLLLTKQKQYNGKSFASSIRTTAKVEMERKVETANQKQKEGPKKPEVRSVPRGTLPRTKPSAVSRTTPKSKMSAASSKTKRSSRITGSRRKTDNR